MVVDIENEIEDTEFRLERGFDLGRFDQFWDDDSLFECRYSRSKWFYPRLTSDLSNIPFEIYSHALKGNKDIIHITFGSESDADRFQDTICNLPWVTSISFGPQRTLPAIQRDLLFIKSADNDSHLRKKFDPSRTLNQHIFSRTLKTLTWIQVNLKRMQEF